MFNFTLDEIIFGVIIILFLCLVFGYLNRPRGR